MKLSMGLRIADCELRISGTAGRFCTTKLQCGSYFAPAATHALSVSFSFAVSFTFVAGGGITSSSIEVMRRTSSLSLTLPRTCSAPSRLSRRSFALRAPSSGPWHLKHRAARMGRTSRLKSGTSAAVTHDAQHASTTTVAHRITNPRFTRRCAVSAFRDSLPAIVRTCYDAAMRWIVHETRSAQRGVMQAMLILKGRAKEVLSLVFAPDATKLYAVHQRIGVHIWNLADRTVSALDIKRLRVWGEFVVHPGGRWAFGTISIPNNHSNLIDLTAGKSKTFNFVNVWDHVAISPDGKHVAAVGFLKSPPRDSDERFCLSGWKMTTAGPRREWERKSPTDERPWYVIYLDNETLVT